MLEDLVGIKIFRMNNKLSYFYCITDCCLYLKTHVCLKFISSNKLFFFGSPRNEQSTYIKDFNPSWRTKSSHLRAAFSTFYFISSKQLSSLEIVVSGGASCCFDEDVHPFTSSFIISTRLLFLHLRIPISSSSLLLALPQCGWFASIFELEVLLVARLVLVFLFTKSDYFGEGFY